ncbi:Ppx/GppA phosphatase family protein [Hydrogenimonas sp.]
MIAIDLGSNTFRAVEIDCESGEPAAWYEKIVRTADGLHESGTIGEEAVARIVEAAKEARRKLDFSRGVVAVTTEAIRRAANAGDVLARIERETGIAFRIISGEEEARYTLLAVRNRLEKLGLPSRRFAMIDIGGGSTEILFYEEGDMRTKSFPVGIVTVAQSCGSLEAIAERLPELTKEMERFICETRHLAPLPPLLVSTAGTPTTVAAMKLGMTYATYDPLRINGTTLRRDELATHLERLLSLDTEKRQELVGVGREDLIAAGILIFERLMEILGFEETIVVDDGLREGVAIAACREAMRR